ILTLNRELLGTLGDFTRIYVFAFEAVAVIFLIIEVVAIVIGIQLTRSMTTTVDRLYQATEKVKKGDLRYRINLPPRDQLSALGEAFDNMTASVERLLRESEEKSRLESELEIAHEVQSRLFPESPPRIPGLELFGLCRPARVVSGDYYDFLRLGDDRVGVVLGDISGKGISAALLMASIQSALHAQFYDGNSSGGAAGAVPISTAEVVGRLNRQLYASTPREKYATFFYGVYDGSTRKLTYTNAGHLPPFLFHQGKVSRLEAGGTVVGLFSSAAYQEAVVALDPGDALLAFTDGVTEPENIYGEEFGEARLLEVAQKALASPSETLVDEICRTVNDWTGEPELQDDMTVVVAKALR
ncbi:MAG TPA: PP2C family protein-serine/threonine phosphatase, partial [Terriglobia bacterium]|nr:PP2C family protein-serine/threonine phosphatase [Terriglobia bacterium]